MILIQLLNPAKYLRNCVLLAAIFGWIGCLGYAQTPAQAGYTFPVPNSNGITGTFMELRGGHFHYGLDIRTYERTGLPVVAAQDGYISWIRVSNAGYGKFLAIKHADSNSTCYGHLEKYMPAVEEYIYSIQSFNKQFDLDLFPEPKKFPVKKGDTIAFTGNTGASSGPHLHYEVRNKDAEVMNPIAWHADVVKDGLAPYINKLAIEPLDAQSRVQGKFEKFIFVPQNSEHQYFYNPVIEVSGKIGLEYSGYDRLFGSRNWNGVYRAELYLDDKRIFEFKMDLFAFNETRYVLQFADYETNYQTGVLFQKCYKDVANNLRVYSNTVNNGYIELKDDEVHTVHLVVSDYHQNKAEFRGKIKRAKPTDAVLFAKTPANQQPTFISKRGTLVFQYPIVADSSKAKITIVYADSTRKTIWPSYNNSGQHVAVLPLDANKVPVVATNPTWAKPLQLNIAAVVANGVTSKLSLNPNMSASFGSQSVFETTPVLGMVTNSNNPKVASPIFQVGNPWQPLFQGFNLKIKYDGVPNPEGYTLKQIVLAQMLPSGKFYRAGADYHIGNEWYTTVTSFGAFCLVADVTPPTIIVSNFKPNAALPAKMQQLKFVLADDISGVHPNKIYTQLDNAWTLPEYYSYSGNLLITFHAPLAPGNHSVDISVTDYVGNTRKQTFHFKVQ